MRKTSAALFLLAILTAGCGGSSSSSSQEGGTFKLGTSSRIDSLNPYVAFNQDAYSAFEYIYPTLIQYDKENAKFVPDFAKSWSTSADGKTWTFKTVHGAKWSDGQPLTAEDAAWRINTDIKYKDTGAANDAGLIAHIPRAEEPNPKTLLIPYAQHAFDFVPGSFSSQILEATLNRFLKDGAAH